MSSEHPAITYAGIGARITPPDVLELMEHVATRLAGDGCLLRSGGAAGADSAFEHGARSGAGAIEVYLPWPGYNDRVEDVRLTRPTPAALEMASDLHPAWSRCGRGARLLHARNSHIIHGPDLTTSVDVVLCWTRDAAGEGGTGQALRCARLGSRSRATSLAPIRIYDLADPVARERVEALAGGAQIIL